jgi:16S rRNA (cytosine967-C5)-methyltransferase
MPVSPARMAAFDILLRVERERSYASELLHADARQSLSKPDHALTTELVMGVLRWRSTLDRELATASSQPLAKLDIEILIALRLALYQFRWLTRVPVRAALNESVELVKRARKRSAAPFVNAVLRKLSSATAGPPGISEDVQFSSQILADTWSHPLWMVDRWISQYGLAAARHICEHNQSIPPTSIRLRSFQAEEELTKEGMTLLPGSILSSARRLQSGDVQGNKTFASGQAVIQDEASQLVATLLDRTATADSIRALDCCAAPGGKTLAVADRNPESAITATEIYPHRARLMKTLLRSPMSSSTRIQIVVADARHLPFSSAFERVLADVPCSGTGTLARNPEIKWRLTIDDLSALHRLQVDILRSAMNHVGPAGRVIYSTCSMEVEENENVVEEVLAENSALRVIECNTVLDRLKAEGELVWPDVGSLTRGPYLRTIPGLHPCDGFFAAILERA